MCTVHVLVGYGNIFKQLGASRCSEQPTGY